MVLRFRCRGCSLAFGVGWYHHHFDHEYVGSNLYVCGRCGAQHRVALPALDRGPAGFDLFDVRVTDVPANARPKVMAALRRILPMSLSEARSAVDALPIVLGTGVRKVEVEDLHRRFGDAGALVEAVQTGIEENPAFGPIQDYRLFVVRRTEGEPADIEVLSWSAGNEIPIEDLPCGDCGTKGTLVVDPRALPPACPRCSGPLSEDGGYVT